MDSEWVKPMICYNKQPTTTRTELSYMHTIRYGAAD